MGRFQNKVPCTIDEHALLTGKTSPQQKHYRLWPLGNLPDDRISKGGPTTTTVAHGLCRLHGEGGIEQQDTLTSPGAEVALLRHSAAQIALQFLENIL